MSNVIVGYRGYAEKALSVLQHHKPGADINQRRYLIYGIELFPF